MLVDDDRDLLRALSIRLRRQGFNVLLAGNGTDGFWRAVQEQPDVVVADCNMPGGSGEHLITRLKDEATTAHIPVVVLTGGSWQERPDINHQRDLTGRRGAVAYLRKPAEFAELLAALLADDAGGMGQRAIGGEPGGLDAAQALQQVTITLLADHEGATGGQEICIELAAVTSAVDDPDAAPRTRLGHRRHRRVQLGVLAHEVRRRLGAEDAQQRHDGGVFVLDRNDLTQPVAVGDRADAAIADPGQGLHPLGVGLGDVGDVEDNKGARHPFA